MTRLQRAKILNLEVISTIERFEKYEGTICGVQYVHICFFVKYEDKSEGYVLGGQSITGRTSGEDQLLKLQGKIWAAKALLRNEEWMRLKQKYGIERDKIMKLSRLGVLSVVKHEKGCLVYPEGNIFLQCQDTFKSSRPEFTPQQVFLVIMKGASEKGDFDRELQFLLGAMQTRLRSPGVYNSDEGKLIRLASAFDRKSLISLGAEVKCGGYLKDFCYIEPGIWQMKFFLSDSGLIVSEKGSVAELVKLIS
ncbi:hypothetical protein N7513_001924 [Penicillium frequentans]|nr:hypothetical protein N7513_001924 [Penicillium glabrum]